MSCATAPSTPPTGAANFSLLNESLRNSETWQIIRITKLLLQHSWWQPKYVGYSFADTRALSQQLDIYDLMKCFRVNSEKILLGVSLISKSSFFPALPPYSRCKRHFACEYAGAFVSTVACSLSHLRCFRREGTAFEVVLLLWRLWFVSKLLLMVAFLSLMSTMSCELLHACLVYFLYVVWDDYAFKYQLFFSINYMENSNWRANTFQFLLSKTHQFSLQYHDTKKMIGVIIFLKTALMIPSSMCHSTRLTLPHLSK